MITIKRIQPQDLPALSQLYHELMGTPSNEQKMHKTFQHMEQQGCYHLLGAFDQEQLVGSVMGIECMDLVGDCEPFMVLENVIVSDRVRRQGIGQKLMLEIEQIAKDRGCAYIILVSGDQRKEAHQFYEKLGFRDELVQGYRKHM
ncbi:GNAT family N-acetyltransferase [Paenibacillus barcinonensis]|uniref:GNAT family N-acetyltransferase n=1 Tax=Paenibacillus barcinonensis TaxID=198119 RepID=A0A2V4VN96_PAEBA|nr:GNAT family N-acetyltransferase [Paenibacillus barcinonensis]PYE47774.1 putative N-acetyltransferase YhbS [Paenibacillus barcinonensis]QKS59114.1 GNAT family N-acetyltransferase [Paenibacillus barcinonensis]